MVATARIAAERHASFRRIRHVASRPFNHGQPFNTWFNGHTRVFAKNGIIDRFIRFCTAQPHAQHTDHSTPRRLQQ